MDSNIKGLLKSYIVILFLFSIFTLVIIFYFGRSVNWHAVCSLIFATTALSKRATQTWSGNSPAEKLDRKLQQLFGSLTLIFGIIALCVSN